MRKGYKITLGILTIMILLTITVGTSYSYYSISDIQKDPNVMNTTCFQITYSETQGSAISLTAARPMADATGQALTPYTFTITNTCTAENATSNNYVVTLNTLTDAEYKTTLPTKYLKYSLGEGVGSTGVATAFPTSTYPLNPNAVSQNHVENSYLLKQGTLNPGDSETFNLRLWINDMTVNCTIDEAGNSTCTPNDVMGRKFVGKVIVYSYM